MRKTTIILLIIFLTMTCFGQSLFFDNINNSTWKSSADFNDSTIRTSKVIGLGKLNHSRDSLKINVTIWVFKNESLVINYYDCRLKKDSLIATYKYKVNADKGILQLILNDNKTLEYQVGIVSTGSYVSLTAFTSLEKSTKIKQYDWTKIKEFRFYGFINPTDKKDAKYILAETDKIKKIFSNLKKSDGFLPKGASRYATITFDNKKKITIQIIAGGSLPFRVIKKDLLTDDWFDFDDSTAREWTDYIRDLTDITTKN